ncbi:MAG: aquaporin [Isosphaeraceae bacterium]|nr:aquaporin [Isosphaeraceae bacterium]
MIPLSRRAIAEFLGTFILVTAGAGAIVVNELTLAVTHPGISLVFGLVVLALIYTYGDVSGCHINPAVTIGFVAARRFPAREAAVYIVAQCAGAIAAAVLLRELFPDGKTLGATLPTGGIWPSFVLEVFLTWFLMLAVLRVSTGSKEKGITAGIAIGAIIGLEALFGGPISGASMNPARSLGPALVGARIGDLWIYIAAPILGALIAVPTFALTEPPGSSAGSAEPPEQGRTA